MVFAKGFPTSCKSGPRPVPPDPGAPYRKNSLPPDPNPLPDMRARKGLLRFRGSPLLDPRKQQVEIDCK